MLIFCSGTQWWTDYQPVSYILTSKRGDRAQYQNMIETCHTAGVKIIAGSPQSLYIMISSEVEIDFGSDTIMNHMSGESSGKWYVHFTK